jgi:hypothetical protein
VSLWSVDVGIKPIFNFSLINIKYNQMANYQVIIYDDRPGPKALPKDGLPRPKWTPQLI